jgi:hypothetical protein
MKLTDREERKLLEHEEYDKSPSPHTLMFLINGHIKILTGRIKPTK